MNKYLLAVLLLLLSLSASADKKSLYEFSLKGAKGAAIDINSFKGKPLLLVNIATKCGYTGQLDDLENLYKKYSKKGLTIIGIPSNDFGGQTPESNEKVAEFCRLKYGVSFPLTAKLIVKGDKKHPLVNHIITVAGGKEISWNFEKFLFDGKGMFVSRFSSSVEPLNSALEKSIKETLK